MNARAVIQRGCSTAIEAALAGVPALAPNWVGLCRSRPVPESVSLHYEDEAALIDEMRRILSGEPTQSRIERDWRELIAPWYSTIDGNAHRRVADAVMSHLPRDGRLSRARNCRRAASIQRCSDWFRSGKRLFRVSRRESPGDKLQRWDTSIKHFDAEQVRSILRTLVEAGNVEWSEVSRDGKAPIRLQVGSSAARSVELHARRAA